MNTYKRILSLAVLYSFVLGTTAATAAEKVISLLSDSGTSSIDCEAEHSFTINIRVDDAKAIAGAALTVTYDTARLTLTDVTSSFFGTFTAQGISPPEDAGSIAVNEQTYDSPQVVKQVTGGSMLAAASIVDGSGTNVDLFTLTFQANGAAGIYNISVAQSVITNTDAGFTSDPTDIDNRIPFFVGIGSGSYPTHTVTTIHNATVTVSTFIDSDHDGIDDNWEIKYRPSGTAKDDPKVLQYYTATGDYDSDGYSNLQEYLNRDTTDPDGNPYNPTVVNKLEKTRSIIPAINALLLTKV